MCDIKLIPFVWDCPIFCRAKFWMSDPEWLWKKMTNDYETALMGAKGYLKETRGSLIKMAE